MDSFSYVVQLGDKFSDLAADQAAWSQATFGSDAERGPLGPLRHLEKEAREAQDEAEKCTDLSEGWDVTKLQEELADCLLLVLDANRRAGLTPMQLVEAAQAKMQINKSRQWSKPVGDQPIEHVRVV